MAYGDGDGSILVGLKFSSYSSINESYLVGMLGFALVNEFLFSSLDDVSFNDAVLPSISGYGISVGSGSCFSFESFSSSVAPLSNATARMVSRIGSFTSPTLLPSSSKTSLANTPVS